MVAAKCFQNHLARALAVLPPGRSLSGALSVSRCSRRRHALRGRLGLAPIRKANLAPNRRADKVALRAYRKRIDALSSQLEAMGVQRLRAHTNPGLELKLHAALLAVTITNAH